MLLLNQTMIQFTKKLTKHWIEATPIMQHAYQATIGGVGEPRVVKLN
jgi:hypothetical protein